MMHMVVIFFLFFSTVAYSLEIDIKSLKIEAQNDSNNVEARIILSQYYIRNKEFKKAKNLLNQVLKIDKTDKKAISLMSKIEGKNKPKDKVKDKTFSRAKMLEKIYQKSGSFSDFKNYYYEVEGLGHKELGFAKLENFVADNSHDEEAVMFLANQYYWNKNQQDSLDVLSFVVDETKNTEILELYANILYELGKFKKSLPYYQKIVRLNGSNNQINKRIKSIVSNKPKSKLNKRAINSKTKAERYFVKKEYQKSIRYFKRYFKNESNDNLTRFHYATALENLKQYSKAQQQYLIVSKKSKKLHELSSYRYARVLMAQREESKWEKARDVLENLIDTIIAHQPTKESDDILKYTQKSLELASSPMPSAKMHKDIFLTAEQSKILNQQVFSANEIESRDITTIKNLLNPSKPSITDTKEIEALVFGSVLHDENLNNNYIGVKITNQTFSIEAKKSTFKNSENKKTKKLNANSIIASYDNGDDFSLRLGVNNFKDNTNIVGKLEFNQVKSNHNITYGLEYQDGVFTNGNTCMIENDINYIALSLYDVILMDNLEQSELMISLNKLSDGNLNINSWANYPILRMINESFENTLLISGNYEYNSKKDTCYYAADFFDSTQLEIKSKYQFNSGYIELRGSVGYSLKNAKVLYSYGLLLQLSTVSINCNHYQSGYSPNGANECYASISHVW